MRKIYTAIPLDQSDEFKLVADHGKFLIAFDLQSSRYKVWAKAPRKRYFNGLKHRGIIWGIVQDGTGIHGTLVRAEQDVCNRLRLEGSWQ